MPKKALFIEPNNFPKLKNCIKSLDIDSNVKSVLFLMAEKDSYIKTDIDDLLQTLKTTIIGGVFPELLFQNNRKDSGVVLLPLKFQVETKLFELDCSKEKYINQIRNFTSKLTIEAQSIFIFYDAIGSAKDDFLESLFNVYGIKSNYIGAGTGAINLSSNPCVIDNSGIHLNSAVIGIVPEKISVGVAHGWEPISDSLKITKANKNRVESIDWKPAFEVYKEIVEEHSGKKFSETIFFDIAMSYPIGIHRIDAEIIVRAPYILENNTLTFVDSLVEGDYIKILHGNIESLLRGVKFAKDEAIGKVGDSDEEEMVFCIDCISRVLFMQDDFDKEIEAIGKKAIVNGALTLGEIANAGESFLEIYNKTIVLSIW